MNRQNIEDYIIAHQLWLFTKGRKGNRLNLDGQDLSGISLPGAFLERASLRNTSLCHANLSYARLQGANLSNSNLRKAVLKGAKLSEASLRCVRLELTDMRMADMWGADLFKTDLRPACLHNARLPAKTWLISGEIYDLQITHGALLRVGCEEHLIEEWRSFSREVLEDMDGRRALNFFPRLMDILDCYLGKGERPAWLSASS